MLNCFWTESCIFYFAVTPFGSVNNAILGTRLRSLACFLSFTVFKISVIKRFRLQKIFSHLIFGPNRCPKLNLVRNYSFLMYQRCREYSQLGWKFLTKLLFATWHRLVAVVKRCWVPVKGRRGYREKWQNVWFYRPSIISVASDVVFWTFFAPKLAA